MLYRPNFCCHCGEKIARARWTPLSSRRFCEFCEIEQKQHDLLPRAVTVIAILIGAAGLTAYIGGSRGTSPSPPTKNSTARLGERSGDNKVRTGNISNAVPANSPDPVNSPVATANAATSNLKQRELQKNSSTEAVYYCGAITKKGTPCTRRVKARGRCWQHVGQMAVRESQE